MIRERLQRYLDEKGMTGPEFAKILGISRVTVWRVLNGKNEKRGLGVLTELLIERELRKDGRFNGNR